MLDHRSDEERNVDLGPWINRDLRLLLLAIKPGVEKGGGGVKSMCFSVRLKIRLSIVVYFPLNISLFLVTLVHVEYLL